MNDDVLGELHYRHGWVRRYSIGLFGREWEVELLVPCDPGHAIEEVQREAFRRFDGARARLLSLAEETLLAYYLGLRDGYSARLGDLALAMVPPVRARADLARLVEPEAVIVQDPLGSLDRVVGLLCSCSWDPQLGVAVKFVNEVVSDVGVQDIVL